MVQIHRSVTLSVPVDVAFSYVSDFSNLPDWLYGLQSIRSVNAITYGIGAQYEAAITLGATLRSTIEVTEYQENLVFGTQSRSGITNQASWRFHTLGPELTQIDGTTTYQLPGGIAGRILAKAIEPFITIASTTSETNLRVALESRYREITQHPTSVTPTEQREQPHTSS